MKIWEGKLEKKLIKGNKLLALWQNISLQKIPYNSPTFIYLEHCSYSWFTYFSVEDIDEILFLHLFQYNKVDSYGNRIKPFLNLSNFVFKNKERRLSSLISFETIFYSIISNSSFSSKFSTHAYINSNCYPNCYIIMENVVFNYNYPFELQYQNIQNVFIRNCTFFKTMYSKFFFHDSGINISSPFVNITPPISMINISAISNFIFEYGVINNFFDINQTWNKSNYIFGIINCLFLESQGTSLIIAENNDLVIDKSIFSDSIVYDLGVIFISKLSSLYISNAIFHNCSSSSDAGAVYFASLQNKFWKLSVTSRRCFVCEGKHSANSRFHFSLFWRLEARWFFVCRYIHFWYKQSSSF